MLNLMSGFKHKTGIILIIKFGIPITMTLTFDHETHSQDNIDKISVQRA